MERERQIKEKKRHIGTHEVLINYMGDFIKKNDGIQRWMNFVLNIIQLKELRVKADYKDEAIVKAQSENSIVLANKVLNTLKSINYGCN